MKAKQQFVELDAAEEGHRLAPIVSETYWGYVVRPAEPVLERSAMIEILAMISGILVMVLALGQWLLPGADLSSGVLPLKVISTLIFAALGVSLIWMARMGLVEELHVDRSKSELRLVQRNRQGHGRLVAAVAFGDVASVRILAGQLPLQGDRLAIVTVDGRDVKMLPSAHDQLLPVRDRLLGDLSPRFRGIEPEPERLRA